MLRRGLTRLSEKRLDRKWFQLPTKGKRKMEVDRGHSIFLECC